MSFSYKKTRKKKLKYNVNLPPYLIDPEQAKELEKKLVPPKQRAKNFKRAVRKVTTKRKTV